MQLVKFVILFVFTLSFCYCKTVSNIKDSETVIELEKMRCNGPCPVFIFSIKENGQAIYQGKENVDMMGTYRSQLNDDQFKQIVEKFEKTDFFSFKDSYKSNMMDLQTKFVTYKKNESQKRVKAYDNIPKKLKFLITELDKLIKNLQWEKV